MAVGLPSSIRRVNSCPMICTPGSKIWLPWAWSKWKCVLITVLTGLLVIVFSSSSSTHAAAGET